ncbi:hypothetical protein SK128_017358 [Halocaridina rubra]|uniref:Sushi domain-containing protein n=1 Tax=Halocaridina rubra TaxID=373956 RepID=A0AAN8WV13_HALRR
MKTGRLPYLSLSKSYQNRDVHKHDSDHQFHQRVSKRHVNRHRREPRPIWNERRKKQLHYQDVSHSHNINGYNGRPATRRYNRHTFGMPFSENLVHNGFPFLHSSNIHHNPQYSFLRSLYQHHNNPRRWVDKLRSQIEEHIDRLTDQLISRHRPKHLPHFSRNREYQLPSPSRHQNGGQNLVHMSKKYPSFHHHTSLANTRRTVGGHQIKVFKNPFHTIAEIPEDVELITQPLTPPPPVKPKPPMFYPRIPTINKGRYPLDSDNCTTVIKRPFHHAVFKFNSASHGNDKALPKHSVDHHITSIITESRRNPFHASRRHKGHGDTSHILQSFPEFSEIPDEGEYDVNSPETKFTLNRFPYRSFKTSVDDHLNNLTPNTNLFNTDGSKDNIPCIKCPPDTHVEAPRGTDCVLAQPPSPLVCTSRAVPDLKTIVTKGPAPGTVLPEGHYSMVFTILTSDATTTTPITTCNVNYDVGVRKCPELPNVAGGQVICTAGRAWGSRCSWTCMGDRILHGSSVTICTGYSQLRWSRPTPICVGEVFQSTEQIIYKIIRGALRQTSP